MQAMGIGALAPIASVSLDAAQVPAPPPEGKDTPKIAVAMTDTGLVGGAAGRGGGRGAGGGSGFGRGAGPGFAGAPGASGIAGAQDPSSGPRRIKQLGVRNVLGGGPGQLPWTEEGIRAIMDRYKPEGITVGNMMINVSNNIIYGRPERDADIEKLQASLVAAGKAGLPVVEYNFYAHRAMEGYFEEIDTERGGSGWTGFDYERIQGNDRFQTRADEKGVKFKDLAPLPNEGAHTLDEIWANITYYLKAVVPIAEKANVRMALHPNDPPAPISRGSQQIMGSLAGWKKLISVVNSPANGITFDCGVTRELGEDPVEVCRYFASRDRINHVHYRNVKVIKPYERYEEVWIDEGMNNMFAVMKELVKNKYNRQVYPEHPRRLDYDTDRNINSQYPGGGGYTAIAYNVGYARAMLQAAMTTL
jgi:mannonate dehydratase